MTLQWHNITLCYNVTSRSDITKVCYKVSLQSHFTKLWRDFTKRLHRVMKLWANDIKTWCINPVCHFSSVQTGNEFYKGKSVIVQTNFENTEDPLCLWGIRTGQAHEYPKSVFNWLLNSIRKNKTFFKYPKDLQETRTDLQYIYIFHRRPHLP